MPGFLDQMVEIHRGNCFNLARHHSKSHHFWPLCLILIIYFIGSNLVRCRFRDLLPSHEKSEHLVHAPRLTAQEFSGAWGCAA